LSGICRLVSTDQASCRLVLSGGRLKKKEGKIFFLKLMVGKFKLVNHRNN